MSRSLPRNAPVRDDAGFTMVELLVAMLIGALVIWGILGLLDTSIGIGRKTEQRIDAAQRGRLALELVSRDIRGEACLSATETPIVSATGTDLIYYANLGTVDALPEKHQIALESGDLVFRRWVGVRAAAGTIPSVTYPVAATATKILAENVQQAPPTPLFRYYAWTPGVSPTPNTALSTPLTATVQGPPVVLGTAALAVRVAVKFTVLPERGFNSSNPTSTFEDSIYSRVADPSDTTRGPICN